MKGQNRSSICRTIAICDVIVIFVPVMFMIHDAKGGKAILMLTCDADILRD